MCCNRTEEITIKHLEMWIDDLRKKINAINDYGTKLERGYALFCIQKQKLELELELDILKKEIKCQKK